MPTATPRATHPPRALPRRFRQPRLLLAGCGDVAVRIAQQINAHGSRYRIRALLRHAPDSPAWSAWRGLGTTPIAADLDQPRSLHRLRGIADSVIYLAPPAEDHAADYRLNYFLAALHGGRSLPRRLVLIGTTGVYGDRQGALTNETCPVRPNTARARRRVAAEQTLRHWQRGSSRVGHNSHTGGILRVPGIYAADRLPTDRLRSGTPALRPEDDTWTNHIHADDLARRGQTRIVETGDDIGIDAPRLAELGTGDFVLQMLVVMVVLLAVSVLDLPFSVQDRAAALAALDGHAGDLLRDAVARQSGFHVLAFWDNGFRHISNAVRPLRSPADCQGLVIRTLDSELYRQALGALGFKAITTDVKELVRVVQDGTVQAQENPLTNLLAFDLWKHHPHVSMSGHFFGVLGDFA